MADPGSSGSSRPRARSGPQLSADSTFRDDGELVEELLVELEEKEWARQAAIEELRR
jgi:hypothetical protein